MISASANPRTADARLLLSRPYRSAEVLPGATAWIGALEACGVRRDEGAPLVVAHASETAAAAATGAESLLLVGSAPPALLQRAGYSVLRVLSVPGDSGPRLLVPLERAALKEAVDHHLAPPSGVCRVRNAVVGSRLGPHLVARRGDDVVTVASRAGLRPYGLHAAQAAGAPATGPWLLVLGHGDALTRAVFVAAGSDFRRGAVAVKLARLPGAAGASFDRDAHGLALASAAGATHVPRLLGGFTVDGARGSVESAGGGEQVGRLLVRSPARAALPLVEAVAEWTTELGLATREPRGLDRGLVADLAAVPGAAEPLSAVTGVPGVLAHNDLGSWNLVTRETDFTVLDWESARAGGLPLADTLYFLTDALGLLAGARTQQERYAAAVALHTGRAEASPLLFRWLRRAASVLQLPPDGVGPLAMLTWLSHSTSRGQRLQRLDDEAMAAEEPYAGRLADAWRRVPELGATWPVFAAWSAR